MLQIKKDLHGKPLKEAVEDDTLPVCWRGKKPFKSIRDAKKYFKPLALSFGSGWKTKSQFEIQQESYLIISVTNLHHFNHRISMNSSVTYNNYILKLIII